MKIMSKMFRKSFKLLSFVLVIALITAMIAVPGTAVTLTGPFTLEYLAGPDGYINGQSTQIVELGYSGISVEAAPYDGYYFVDWSDGSTQNPRTDTNVTGDISVTAYFAAKTFSLNYYADENGTIIGEANQTVVYPQDGSPVTAVPNAGYIFECWSDGSFDNPRIDYAVYWDVDVTAYFTIDSFSLDYSAGSNGYLSGNTWQTVEYGGSGTAVTAIPNANHHFVGWSDGLTDNPRIDTNVTQNIEVMAIFAIDTFTLTYTAGANGSIAGETVQIVDYEADGTTVTANADEGYRFIGWSDGSTDNPRTDYVITDNLNVTANFAFLYTVSFNTQGGSAVPDQLVPAGGMVDYPVAPSRTGLYFAGWYQEASCVNIWHSRMDLVSSNTTLYARWSETAPKVAVLCGEAASADVQAKLISTGYFSQVDIISVWDETPTLGLLKQYNAVLIYSNASTYNNPAAWGDVLADYADYGGGVVLAAFTFAAQGGSLGIDGRISTGGYLPFTQISTGSGYYLTLVPDAASDPILNGVNSFDGGQSSYLCHVDLVPGANLIAHWSNDIPLVATKQGTSGRVVGLNFFPPSSDVRSDFWDASTDGAFLMANALVWAASTGGTINPPAITSDGGGDSASISVDENQTTVTTVTAADPDSVHLTYSISGGYDASRFVMDATSGVLSFLEAPNFESPVNYYTNNIYEVTVQVSDGELTDSQKIYVTVTDINEAPVITSNGGEATASISAKEDQTAVCTITAIDPDDDASTFGIFGGADAACFNIGSTTGVLTFKVAPDFEIPGDANADGIYEVTVYVSDGTLTDSQTILVTVTLLTPIDLLNVLRSDIRTMVSEGKLSSSTANGLIRTIDKAIAKINTGDYIGASKLLTSMKTTINRQVPRKIASSDAAYLTAQIDLIITRLLS
ncbi:MAG: InlB B-repeat-containing protein [Saccharofermentanales bacterium]